MVRKSRKISAWHFVLGFLISAMRGQSTLSGWATQIAILCGKQVSKQGLFERVQTKAVSFARELVKEVLVHQSRQSFATALFVDFKRVLLHDSTTLRLPGVLSCHFPGNHSRGEQRAVARIQTMLDVKRMQFLNFELGSFTQNDQSASPGILSVVQKGDIVIRDLGYAVLSVFEELSDRKIDFLSRLKYGVAIFDLKGRVVELNSLLSKNKVVDRWVLIGTKQKVKVRLVMLPLPADKAAAKVRKAKKDRDRRLNHSKDYLKWIRFNIYVTTVDEVTWKPKDVYRAYGVRWQIEIVFKSWKSGFGLQHLLHEGYGNVHRVKVSIYLMLLYMCLLMHQVYDRYREVVALKKNKTVSLLKVSKFFACNMVEALMLSHRQLVELIALHCCYDRRSDRINMTDLYQNL